jgi:hypothetical protein
VAQRRLSTPVRDMRRRTEIVHGELVGRDGVTRRITRATLTEPAESALRVMSVAMPLLAVGLVANHLL